MRGIPERIGLEVAGRLYSDAQRLDWLHMSHTERRRQYATWLDALEVGGVLTQFLSREAARVWIKDGPMKEFARAMAGVGRFASLIGTANTSPDQIAKLSLGAECEVVPGSLGIKPLHCVVERPEGRHYLCWGPPKDFKHLLWAALNASDASGQPAHVVITERVGDTLSTSNRRRFQRLCGRCSVDFISVELS